MDSKLSRRDFFKKSAITGAACCAIIAGSKVNAFEGIVKLFGNKQIDPKNLNYCGYTCPEKCSFKVATEKDDEELKLAAYNKWKIKEKYKLEFDPQTAFCYGCKPADKPLGVAVSNCKTRKCSKRKGYDSCIQCRGLSNCRKPLWQEFPSLHEASLELQKKYFAQLQRN